MSANFNFRLDLLHDLGIEAKIFGFGLDLEVFAFRPRPYSLEHLASSNVSEKET